MEISKIITKNNHLTTEKSVISDSLNEHFISSGPLFAAQSHNNSTLNSLIVPSNDISCKLITVFWTHISLQGLTSWNRFI